MLNDGANWALNIVSDANYDAKRNAPMIWFGPDYRLKAVMLLDRNMRVR